MEFEKHRLPRTFRIKEGQVVFGNIYTPKSGPRLVVLRDVYCDSTQLREIADFMDGLGKPEVKA